MKVYEEISLKDFDFWNYAVVVADNMNDEDFDMVEQWMEEDGRDWDKTAINDLFAFNYEFVETLVGHNLVSENERMNRKILTAIAAMMLLKNVSLMTYKGGALCPSKSLDVLHLIT